MSTIKIKRSAVQGKVPLDADLELGELAINTYDGKLFLKKSVAGANTIVDLSTGGSTNLTVTSNSSTVTVSSSTGTDAIITAANSTIAGVLTADAQTISGAKTFLSNITFNGSITAGTWNGSVITGTYGGTGVNNGTKTITLGGNISTANSLTTSGNFALTLNTTATTSVTLPASGTLATTGNLSQFAATTSAQLAGVISDETGTGLVVFNSSPTLIAPTISGNTSFDSGTAFVDSVNNRVGIGTTSPSAKLDVIGDIGVNSTTVYNATTTTIATTAKSQIASLPLASYRSGKILVQAYDTVTGDVQISELLMVHNGTAASATEYGVTHTGTNPIAVYDVDISGANVRLMTTRTTSNSTVYRVLLMLMVS